MWRLSEMAKRILGSVLVVLAALGLWALVVFAPIEWPLSPYQHEDAVFPLGPVSADVQAGQSFAALESFDVFAVPVKVGGPVDEAASLRVRVRIGGPTGLPVAESSPTLAVSTQRSFEIVKFRFPETIPAGVAYFVEIDVPRETPWPIFLAATGDEKDSLGQLFLQGAPTFAGQDLAYQLLRRQSILGRLLVWWTSSRGAVVVGAVLIALVHVVSFAAIGALPRHARRPLAHWSALALVPPALLAAAYFALMFFVL